jgi:lysophospholipase L1-like esterase
MEPPAERVSGSFTWFPEPETPDPSVGSATEPTVTWLSRSTRPNAVTLRRRLNEGLAALPAECRSAEPALAPTSGWPAPGELDAWGALPAPSSMARKLLRALALFATAALLLPLGASEAAPPTDAAPAVYLSLGDSLGVGVGSTPFERTGVAHTSYAEHLRHLLRGQPHGGIDAFVNLARRGETTSTFLLDGQAVGAAQVIAAPSDVRVITLSLGGNDLLGLLSGPCADPLAPACEAAVAQALGTVSATYPRVLAALLQALAAGQDPGGAQLLALTVYNPFSGTGSRYEAPIDRVLLGVDLKLDCTAAVANPLNAGLNDIIACTARAAGVTVVDLYPVFQDRGATLTHIRANDIHPTDAGYAAIATALRQNLRG